jgi:hypothetical protein
MGGEYGMRTPVEMRETREAGPALDVGVPVKQATWTSFAAMLLWLAGILAVRAMGREVFWLVAAVICLGHIAWAIWIAGQYETAHWNDGALISTCVAGLLFACLGGLFFVAVDRVAFGFPKRLLAVTPLVGALVFFGLLALGFVQELALRSPFIEEALGKLIHQEKPPWHQSPPFKDSPRDPIIVHTANRPPQEIPPPVAPAIPALTPEQMEAVDLEEFLVSGDKVGYGRRVWVGHDMRSGSKVTDTRYRKWIALLCETGWMETGNAGTRLLYPLSTVLAGLSPVTWQPPIPQQTQE